MHLYRYGHLRGTEEKGVHTDSLTNLSARDMFLWLTPEYFCLDVHKPGPSHDG